MAYFSNGTEGLDYEQHYCERCDHRPVNPDAGDCPIWVAHMLFNYDREKNEAVASILDSLIPMVPRTFKDGLTVSFAGECKFFQPRRALIATEKP